MSSDKFIPYGRQDIDQDDIDSVINVLKSDFLTQGPEVEKFENEICKMTGAKYCVVVSNGTAALHLAVLALELPEKSIGYTTTNTFVASANCLSYCDIETKLVDIDENNFNLDLSNLEDSISSQSGVVIPVHFAGRPVDMEKLSNIAKKRNLNIIEDASHAIGSQFPCGAKVGSCKYSDLTTFSFHPVKTITSGEGGAITTNDIRLFEKLKLLRTHGISRENLKNSHGPWYYQMIELGFNFRMTDIQATLGLSQLRKLEFIKKKRQEIVKTYNELLKEIDWLETPLADNNSDIVYHLYVIRIDFDKIKLNKKEVMEYLKANRIGTQVHYIPVHLQKYYQDRYQFKRGDFPVSEAYYDKALSIPLYPTMDYEDIEHVVEVLKKLETK